MFRDSPQQHRSETSYPPVPLSTGDNMVVNSDEMRTLLQHRRELDESLAQLEAQIFHEEGAYIRETPCGNVIRGFECFHDSKLNNEQPKKSRMEVIEERIFSKSSYIFWQKSRERAAKEDAKKRDQQQAMIANRGMYMGGNLNGSAAGVGHIQPLSYGTHGSSMHGGAVRPAPAALPAPSHHGNISHKSHKKRHPDGHSHSHKKKKKKRSSTPSSLNAGYGGGNSQGGDGSGGGSSGSSMPVNRFDPM
ncbi:unnamed protein product [Ascophyllum nodosum]